MERLPEHIEKRGLSSGGLRAWGYLFLAMGVAGRGLIQNGILGLTGLNGEQILKLMEQSGDAMLLVTVSLILQAMETCAVPIFAFLTVEGFLKTASLKHYALRVALVAVACEIPYNLAIGGSWLELSSRNPAFGLVFCLAMLWFFRYIDTRSGSKAVKLAVVVAAMLWCAMLGIAHGAFLVLLTAVLWWMRGKPMRTVAGCAAAALGTVFSLFNLASPMAFLAIHFYNGEKGESSRVASMLCYPLMLLAVCIFLYLI